MVTDTGDLVEVYSGSIIEVLDNGDGAQRVVLRSNGVSRSVYSGPKASEFVTGLARYLGAKTAKWLVENGAPLKGK